MLALYKVYIQYLSPKKGEHSEGSAQYIFSLDNWLYLNGDPVLTIWQQLTTPSKSDLLPFFILHLFPPQPTTSIFQRSSSDRFSHESIDFPKKELIFQLGVLESTEISTCGHLQNNGKIYN